MVGEMVDDGEMVDELVGDEMRWNEMMVDEMVDGRLWDERLSISYFNHLIQ